MQFIKTLFWVILAVILVVFAANNWSPTSVLIWEDVRIDTKLPVLVIGAFLLGFVPLWILHRASRWRLRRRIKTLETAAQPAPATSTAVQNASTAGPSSPVSAATSSTSAPPASGRPSPAPPPLDLEKEQITPAKPAVSPVSSETATKPPEDKASGA